jgi:hypothetical protein
MKQIKIIPPWMCHTVFHSKLNSNDLKLFYVLIAMCSYEYNKTTYTEFSFKIKDIKEALGTAGSIKTSLVKINDMKITSNFFRSYTIDKDIANKRRNFKPFSIDFGTKKRANNITITVDKDFIDYFEEHNFKKPNGKFSLSYRYLDNIDNIQHQLLYMYLADRVANNRDDVNKYIDTKDLALLMNRPINRKLEYIEDDLRNAEAKFEEVDIDIKFEWETIRKLRPIKNDKYQTYYECKFIITRTKEQPRYIQATKIKARTFVEKTKYDEGLSDDEIDLANKLIVNIIDFHIQDYKENNNKPIGKMIGFKRTIKANHFLDESKMEILEIDAYIKEKIDTIVNSDDITIDNSYPNSLAFSNIQSDFYQVNNSYFLYKNKEQITTTIKDTYRFLKKEDLTPCIISNPYPQFSISSISMKTSKKQSDEQQQDNTNTDNNIEEALAEIDRQSDLDKKEEIKKEEEIKKLKNLFSRFVKN